MRKWWIITAVVVVLFLLGAILGEDAPDSASSDADADDGAPAAAMLEVRGQTVKAATGKLEDHFDGDPGVDLDRLVDVEDYSAERRYDAGDDWVVVYQMPAAGAKVAEGTQLHVFALRAREVAWFRALKSMPAVPSGVPTPSVLRPGSLFGPVRELIELRYPKGSPDGYHKQGLLVGIDRIGPRDPRVEPRAWRFPRDRMKSPYGSEGTLTTGASLPGRGTVLATGRVLTLLVRDKPEPPPPVSEDDGGNYYNYGDDDDDDINIPGWLCPTRFC